MEIINISSARWLAQLKNSVFTPSQLVNYLEDETINSNLETTKSNLQKVVERYPMRITPYYLSLIKFVGDPIWKQAVPDPLELSNNPLCTSNNPLSAASNFGISPSFCYNGDSINHTLNSDNSLALNFDDPLNEESQSPVPSIIHRYPDRVIFLVSNQCAMYCRYCMRKRKVGLEDLFESKSDELERITQGLNYIKNNKTIRDVILSGGDPLLLTTETLDKILFSIRKIEHVETIRIHTRVLCTLPFRITDNLASVLEKYHPLYINTHFNHPSEITDEATSASFTLISAGVPLGCQTVLLKGVNDTPEVMIELMRKLIKIRIKPYYLHHPDLIAGTAHFRPSLDTGLNIIKAMRGNLTGIAIPQYMVDLPGGYGKVPMLPNYIKYRDTSKAVLENYQGKSCEYWF